MGERPAVRARTHRSAAAWLSCLVLVAVAVTLPALAVRDARGHAELLRHRGVRVTADVVGSDANACEVAFVDRGRGGPRQVDEKMYGCHSGRVGEKPAVVYDPRHPAMIDYASRIGVTREYALRAPLIVVPSARPPARWRCSGAPARAAAPADGVRGRGRVVRRPPGV